MSDVAFEHSKSYRYRRFLNWFPLGLTYAFLYWGRYNLTVAKNSLSDVLLPDGSHVELLTKGDFGLIFGIGTVLYAFAFLVNGPLTDRIGGRFAMMIGATGAMVANAALGVATWMILTSPDPASWPIVPIYSAIYATNMYFQSFGAVSIVKVNANWFHVRERGGFSGIFGVMISSGIFFAFDVSQRVLSLAGDARWWVFFAPAIALAVMLAVEFFLLKDKPSDAGHEDFDTGDASSGESGEPVPTKILLKRILTHPVIMTVAAVEFCTGVLRNGVMHWFPIYAKEQVASGMGDAAQWDWFLHNWGLLLMIAGILGGNIAGWVSDKVFGSRRAPVAALLYGMIAAAMVGMFFSLTNPLILGSIVFFVSLGVIGTHGLLSGTATMDFGGRSGAATAVGVIDGFVYLGTGLQSFALGYLTQKDWAYWPPFLFPFAILGLIFLMRIWNAMPTGKKGGGH
jgi:MFS transporter, OPA family, glycerol-3-phosphate transporter